MATPDDKAPWQGHTEGSREYRLILLALTCAGIATFAQLYSPQGVLPRIAEDLRVRADQAALLISAATIGLALGVLPWSWLADRLGRVRAMKASLIVATLCGFAVTAWPSFEGILVLRALEGLALGGLPAAAIAYLNEEVHPSHAGMAAAIYVSGTTVGGLSGRVLSVPVADAFGWRTAILVVTGLGALATLAFVLSIPAPRGFKPGAPSRMPLLAAIRVNLRAEMLVLFAQGFLLMGGLVAIYNYMTFHLEAAPFSLSPATISLLLFSYLAGTFSASWAGRQVRRHGRLRVLCGAIAVMVGGAALLLSTVLAVFVSGLLLFTAGVFAAHAIAAGWVGQRATRGRSQAASLYNLFYYAGLSFFGWFCGLVFVALGWAATVATVMLMAVTAAGLAIWHARRHPAPERAGSVNP